ncbi:hypothetical protein L6452_03043 [Arctium lappa]|uniref:Uncharacterized protein n=1 Tax=Arctium lappa TaxID=4217 RepID=A0ACB9FL33_ARCLA|nr:hypothetical protein L6452_03043 [Arctium lappa]
MSVSLTVMTFNLLEDQPEDGPNCWEKRKDLCVSVITSYSPIILCTQQGVKSQLEYLQQCLPDLGLCENITKRNILNLTKGGSFLLNIQGYDQFGISRKGSEDVSDQHCTIFYDKEKVELLEGGTFWLSESPSVPGSMSWGGVSPCIATPRARRRSALLTWQHIASLPPSLPVAYCGGFNTQKESTTGRFLLGRSREHGVVGDMRDAWPNARLRKNMSLIRTYHGFKGNKQGAVEFLKLIFRALCLCWDRQTQDLHIDWILFRGRSLVPVSCEVVSDNIDGHYPSSHYPIFAEFMLPRTVRLLDPPPTEETLP